MSADLEISGKPREIRLPVVDIESVKSSSEETGSVVIQTEIDGYDGSEESCKTPTSEEHKIPAMLSCPPAPRKTRTRSVLCKRKLDFFEIENFQEVEDFFRSSFDSIEKKRCTACK